MRILLIEDEPAAARAITVVLNAEAFKVYTKSLAEEGLDLDKF